MYNLICRSGILHSTNREQLRQTAFTWDKNCSLFWKLHSSILQFLLLVEQLCRPNLQNDPYHLQQHILAAHFSLKTLLFSSLYFSSYKVSAEHRYSFSAPPYFILLYTYMPESCTATTGFIQKSLGSSSWTTWFAQGQGQHLPDGRVLLIHSNAQATWTSNCLVLNWHLYRRLQTFNVPSSKYSDPTWVFFWIFLNIT